MEDSSEQSSNLFQTIGKLFLVFGLLYLFLISIGMMGAAFKGFGKEFADTLLRSTANPFLGLFVGIFATSLVQSSSTTTSIIVGMVASGALPVEGAIPIIMGANIGTTVTNTLVSLGHVTRREEFRRAIAGATVHDFFNLICVAIMLPLQLATGFLQKAAVQMEYWFEGVGGLKFTSPVKTATKPVVKAVKHFFCDSLPFGKEAGLIITLVVSFIIMYIALFFVVKVMRSLVIKQTESVFHKVLGKSGFIGVFAGIIFTVFVQSSSITTSILIPLIAAGVITIETAFPITMGANIGTTCTAILASLATGNPAAITIAFVHFLFNLFGVVFIYPIAIFRAIPIALAKGLGDLAFKKRRYAVIYVFSLFFIIPGILIFLSRLF